MIEGDLVNALRAGFETSRAWYFQKIDNTARGTKKPCDAWVSWCGRAGGIEVKLHKGRSDFHTLRTRERIILQANDFRDAQLPSLERMRVRHVAPIIVIGVHNEKDRTTRVFALRLETFNLGNRSMTLGDLEDAAGVIEFERTVGGGWKIPNEKCEVLFGVAHSTVTTIPGPPPWKSEIELIGQEH